MPKVVETIWASLGKDKKDGTTEYIQVGAIKQHQDGSRYVSMNRLFNYSVLPGGDVKLFHLRLKPRQPGDEG